jgi:hypothetical protein
MLRYLWLLLLTALLLSPALTEAQWPPPGPRGYGPAGAGISGRYQTQSGQWCSVQREDGGYLFVNEQGSPAHFVFTGPNELSQTGATQWDPSVVCTVSRDRSGRTVLRFDSPNAPPGYWVSAD